MRAEDRSCGASNHADPMEPTDPCIRTDRLSPRQLRTWKAIEAMVFARDAAGRLKHRMLHSLWQSVEAGGNVVHVEFPPSGALGDREAGKFVVEKSSPDGHKHIAVIRLCLSVIDEALVSERTPGPDGFIRFQGLGKKERYAEILGHELAHAVWALGDQNHARRLVELDALVEEFERSRRRSLHDTALDEHEWQLLRRIESLMMEVEGPAKMAEAEIWKELLEGRKK